MTTNPPSLQGMDIDAVHTRRTSQADHVVDANKLVSTTHPTKGTPLGATAKTVLECIKANPGQSTHRVYELLQATANPCPAWEATKKTIQNLRQLGHIENRNPVEPRGGRRLPGEWHATGKAEFVRPSTEQLAAAKALAKAQKQAQAVQRQAYGRARCGTPPKNKSPDGGRMLAALAAHIKQGGLGMTVRQLAEAAGLTPDTARCRIEHLVLSGKLLKIDIAPPGSKTPVIRLELPGEHNARRDGRSRFVAHNRPNGQDGSRLTTSAVPCTPGNFLGWSTPARTDALDANKKLSREGNNLTPYTGIHSQCSGPGQLFMAPSRLQR